MHKFFILILGLILITSCAIPTDIEAEKMTERKRNVAGNTTLNGKKGWSSSGSIQATNGYDPVLGPNAGVSLQANFDESDVYTAQFFIGPVPPDAAFGAGEFIRARAEVTWSVEGNFVRRVIDVVNGASITGVAQGVKIRIFDDSVYSTAKPAINYDVSASVSRGARSSVQQPPVYSATSLQLAAGAQNGNIPIPQNAGVISVMLLVGTVATVPSPNPVTEFSTICAQVTAAPNNTTLRVYDARDYQWVPVAPGADHLLIVKDATTPILHYTAIFGIDG